MDFKELVTAARTRRRYVEAQRLGLEGLQWLVDCARLSPCSRNSQTLRYVVAHSLKGCEAIFPHTRWAGALQDWDGPAAGERPTGYIGILTPAGAGKLVHMDVGIAAQTMQLAAQSKGWGCCMHGSFDQGNCAKAWNIPADMEISLILAMGVALEECVVAPMPADNNFNYWRDAKQIHHVPKRALEEVLINKI